MKWSTPVEEDRSPPVWIREQMLDEGKIALFPLPDSLND